MRFRNWLALLFCGTLCGGMLLCCGFLRNPCGWATGGVEMGREYYLYNPSSQAKITSKISFTEYFSLVGEKYTLRFFLFVFVFPHIFLSSKTVLCFGY